MQKLYGLRVCNSIVKKFTFFALYYCRLSLIVHGGMGTTAVMEGKTSAHISGF